LDDEKRWEVWVMLSVFFLIACPTPAEEGCESRWDCDVWGEEICRDGACVPHDGVCETDNECANGFCKDGFCCGDWICQPGEDCSLECYETDDTTPNTGPECGDGVCEFGEDCPPDCVDVSTTLTLCNNSYQRPSTACTYPPSDWSMLVPELGSFWGVTPRHMCYYDNFGVGWNTVCGPLQMNNAVYCAAGGYIAVHEEWLLMNQQEHGSAIPAVVHAHEWGHLIQHTLGMLSPTQATTVAHELQADCLSGLYMFHVNGPYGDMGYVDEALSMLWELVYKAKANTPWGEPLSHGNFEQRATAFSSGVQGAAVLARGNGGSLCGLSMTEVVYRACPLY
jgi:hypothetical protein